MLFGKEYFQVKKKVRIREVVWRVLTLSSSVSFADHLPAPHPQNGCSPFETMVAYLGGSAFQTVIDNPVTAYRQLVQQYAKDAAGKVRMEW